MITSNSMPISTVNGKEPRIIPTSELIDRLAAEMRETGDRELPLSFYVEQVKRKLANENAANDDKAEEQTGPAAASSSVFACWALPEQG
ncbi:hypothetical protein [Agrobacterium larrymoorei]|uniref:Uncharacterized protein n=1 Tax=Agrobacterium larrymoorei TaxID=160699 RepID=A0ABU0UNU1_9HYPH|nr:hypothetical protein [Agrobacterium larrymoorei]MDQ1186632.1 hypothetical protein [Agrobacterium larrymoorei]